jgi:signal transduction histidine kinase
VIEVWRGIRVRTTALATLVVIAVLVVTGFALVTSQRRILTADLDEALLTHSDALVAAARGGNLAPPLTGQGDDDAIAQIVTEDGQVIAATTNFTGEPALPPPTRGDGRQFRTIRPFTDEPEYRLLSRRDGAFVVHTAAPTDDIDDSIAALRLGLGIAIPLAAVALAALTWWLVGLTLRPVEAMRREVADISGRNLHRRVPEPATGDEIAQLARTMNAMLDRVENALEAQRRFVADASHELRSPLTRIRSELEVDLEHPDNADLAATHRSVLEEADNLQRLVEDLLLLARSDSARDAGGTVVLVDLDDIVLREALRIRTAGSVRVDITNVSAAQVPGNPDELRRVVRNLVDNAARHAGSTIAIALAEQLGHAVLTVADDGPGIPVADRERIFERFARLDEARTSHDGGTGLGLAIAREIIERHGGTIRVDPDHRPGTRFIVELPREPFGS